MKKIKLYLMTLCFSMLLIPSLPVYASENIDQSQTNYGEIKDGLFVKTLEEEVAHIPKDSDIYFEEWNKALNSHMIGTLTPEMEKAGYVLVNGMAYSPEDAKIWVEGDASEGNNVIKITGTNVAQNTEIENYDENGNPIVAFGNGYVTFVTTCHPDIHEVCFVEVTNTTSNKVYSFELYEQNSYNKSIQLPAGSYFISSGGIKEDYTSKYPISECSFEVTAGASTIVNITIGNITEQELKGIVVPIMQETTSEETISPTTEDVKETIPQWVTVVVIILLFSIAIISLLFIKKNKNK